MKDLTANQRWVLEALRKRKCDFIAAATERHWKEGERYYIDDRVPVSREIRRRFEQGNQEATGETDEQ